MYWNLCNDNCIPLLWRLNVYSELIFVVFFHGEPVQRLFFTMKIINNKQFTFSSYLEYRSQDSLSFMSYSCHISFRSYTCHISFISYTCHISFISCTYMSYIFQILHMLYIFHILHMSYLLYPTHVIFFAYPIHRSYYLSKIAILNTSYIISHIIINTYHTSLVIYYTCQILYRHVTSLVIAYTLSHTICHSVYVIFLFISYSCIYVRIYTYIWMY